ncbi:MAG: translational GTPase TypA [Dehalococcoidia bacterium]|jgi:GTP-binding protein|nr:translational GTPase TypA [Dehalococcoidia bacterium]
MTQNLRNIAIIAHVDHGKTTLVDAMLKQSHIFRDNQQVGDLILDSNELEREKGITILAKNTAITYKGVKINIIDTPGHADFSGEVERVLNMADGCLLVTDAVDGPMGQTRFVLHHALQKRLKPIVVINKVDRSSARPEEVVNMVQDLFLELATDAEQLDFPILYTDAKVGYAVTSLGDQPRSMVPLFEAILEHIPPPGGDAQGDFQMLVAALSYDSHLGQIAVGRIARGKVAAGDQVARVTRDGAITFHKVSKLFVFNGLSRDEVAEVGAGEIIALAGLWQTAISDTITSEGQPMPLPAIDIGEPTVQMTFGVNTSPFSGQDGRYVTSRQLRGRLMAELQTNVSLQVQETDSADVFLVSGRGELHLAILIESMRREGYEFQVSRPKPITKVVDGHVLEPCELLVLSIDKEAIGMFTEELSSRLAQMTNMLPDGQGHVRLEFKIPTSGLIGFRSFFLTATRGNGQMDSVFTGYEPLRGEVKPARRGALVAAETGVAVTYGLNNAQQRGRLFIEPGTQVYEGMIVGVNARDDDLVVNVCKEKKMTNMRSSTSDIATKLTPALRMSLEESIGFIAEDEMVEVTPGSTRLRKHIASNDARYRQSRGKSRALSLTGASSAERM